MTDKATNTILLIALLKASTEHSTFLTKEYKQKQKQQFNNLIQQMDRFIDDIESKMNAEEKELLSNVADSLHEIVEEIRNQSIVNN